MLSRWFYTLNINKLLVFNDFVGERKICYSKLTFALGCVSQKQPAIQGIFQQLLHLVVSIPPNVKKGSLVFDQISAKKRNMTTSLAILLCASIDPFLLPGTTL